MLSRLRPSLRPLTSLAFSSSAALRNDSRAMDTIKEALEKAAADEKQTLADLGKSKGPFLGPVLLRSTDTSF